MTDTWRFEIYDRHGQMIVSRERQSFQQVWFAAIDCTNGEKVKFKAPPETIQSDIDRLRRLGAEPVG